jgi:hypothetical protein
MELALSIFPRSQIDLPLISIVGTMRSVLDIFHGKWLPSIVEISMRCSLLELFDGGDKDKDWGLSATGDRGRVSWRAAQ